MSNDDRRSFTRAVVPLDGSWEGASGRRAGRIADISLGGCFVESMNTPSVGEDVSVHVTLPSQMELALRGHVVYAMPGMGFGVRFAEVSGAQHLLLQEAILHLLGR